jgi:hypothetical protein
MSIVNDDIETGFDEDESNFDENESDIIDDNSVNSDDEISFRQKKNRGKGLNWSEPLCDSSGSIITYINHDKIVEDAKKSCKGNHIYNYKCKVSECQFLFKYCRTVNNIFTAQFYGKHNHSDSNLDLHRGLSESQKSLVLEAISEKNLSARVIQQYFRNKRKASSDDENFPPDPTTMKLNNFLQAYKKKNISEYNPSPSHLEEWCLKYSQSTIDINNKNTYDIPFVLGYKSVSDFSFLSFPSQ